jgi:hypothetical protein
VSEKHFIIENFIKNFNQLIENFIKNKHTDASDKDNTKEEETEGR